jgi:hypothetical protein
MSRGRWDGSAAGSRRSRAPAAACLLIASLAASSSLAGVQLVVEGVGEVFAGAGFSSGSVDEVRFTVPGSSVGSGVPVQGLENGGRADTLLFASARTPAAAPRTAIWTVDSSQPLTCVTPELCGSTTIPLTRFRWEIIEGGDVASGRFDGTPSQTLATFSAPRLLRVRQTLWYANDEVVPAGRYAGRVVYTVSMP